MFSFSRHFQKRLLLRSASLRFIFSSRRRCFSSALRCRSCCLRCSFSIRFCALRSALACFRRSRIGFVAEPMPLNTAPMSLNGNRIIFNKNVIIHGANFNSNITTSMPSSIASSICHHARPLSSVVVYTGLSASAAMSVGFITTGIIVVTLSFVNVRSMMSKSSCTHICAI